MANTFTQIYIQIVFAVRNRLSLIQPEWEEDLFKYITGIVQKKEQKMLAINGTKDHIHFFIGMKPTCCLSDLVREVKKSSVSHLKSHRLIQGEFNWQEGFGAFSYGNSQIDHVIRYINNQKQHHQNKTFEKEYKALLKAFEIEFKNEYLFEWLE
jgi:REP element-mobilizing transposase RayT